MMSDVTTHIGILFVDLFIPTAQSLKNKRAVLKSIKDRVRPRFNVSVAELDHRDKWQTATLGFGMIGGDQRYLNRELENLLSLIRSHYAADVCDHRIEFY